MRIPALPRQVLAALVLLGIFLIDLVVSSIAVARIVLARQPRTHPAIVIVPVELRHAWATVIFACFLSLTPGSTCLHVSEDRRRLYVHLLDAEDPARAVARFKRLYERWIRRLEP